MKGRYLLLSILAVFCSLSFSAQAEKYNLNEIADNPKEAFYYVKRLEKFYPLLWKGKDESLKGDNIEEYCKDQNAIWDFKINEIKAGGALEKRWKIANRQGFFNLMEESFKAPQKTVVDLREKMLKSNSSAQKVVGTLLVCKYIYYLQILQLAEKNKWEDVVHNLTVWTNVVFIIQPNGTFKKSIERLIDHLLAKYKIPEKERDAILKLKKRLLNKLIGWTGALITIASAPL